MTTATTNSNGNGNVINRATISAKPSQDSAMEITVKFPFHNMDMKALVSELGEAYIMDAAIKSVVITLQANMRRWIEKGLSEAEIQDNVNNWRPNQASGRGGKTISEKTVAAKLVKMSPAERQAWIENLMKEAGMNKTEAA